MFYDRHVKALLGYFARRTRDPEVAADLTAETFASALVARRRFKPDGAPAAAWLFAIAARRLAGYRRRGRVEQRMRRSLEMERRDVSEADAEMIRLLGEDAAQSILAELPPDQRGRIAAHVIEERPYDELRRRAGHVRGGARGRADERLRLRAAARPRRGGGAPGAPRASRSWASRSCVAPAAPARGSASAGRRCRSPPSAASSG